MYEYSQECLETFLKKQGQLFDEPVAETLEEAEEFLEDCMAVVVDSLKEVRAYLEESGMDVSGLSSRELEETPEEIARALKDMRRICDLFVCPGRLKRGIVGGILKMVSRELPDQIMGREPDPACAESNARMRELFDEAVPQARALFENFVANIDADGLDGRFDRNYE